MHKILGELKNYQNEGSNAPAEEEKKAGEKESWEEKMKQGGEKVRGVRKIKIAIIDSKENRQPVSKKPNTPATKNVTSTKNKPKTQKKPVSQSLPKRDKQSEVA